VLALADGRNDRLDERLLPHRPATGMPVTLGFVERRTEPRLCEELPEVSPGL